MKVSPENIFPGAKIKMGLKDLTVVKVNEKSFYATELSFSDYTEKFESRIKGTTFKKFCEMNNVISYKYTEEFRIDEEEAGRKDIAIVNKNIKYDLGKAEKIAIANLVKEFKKKKKSLRLIQFEVGKNLIRFLDIRDETNFLMNVSDDYVLYSIDTDESIKISTVYDYKFDHIPWEKLSKYSNELKETSAMTMIA